MIILAFFHYFSKNYILTAYKKDVKLGSSLKILFIVFKPPKKEKIMKRLLAVLACRLGLHSWEKDPSQKDIVKGTGVHIAFWSEALQKATRCCTRESCQATQKVYRHGMCGVGVKDPDWKPMSDEQERRIDALPNVFHA